MSLNHLFTEVSSVVSRAAGHAAAFIICCGVVLIWAASGPIFNFSDTWQLVINTGTTIVTFLMVFLIQNTQNRDGAAIQAKLDELIRASAASNAFIGIEYLTQEEVDQFRSRCEEAARTGRAAVDRARAKAKEQSDASVQSI
jgi:low affinity Fe/Cu permease